MGFGSIWLGRQRELADLEAGLDDLATGRGGLYLVVGEPGIGKTRLCDELARSAATRGIAVHWGRAWEVGGAPPYWPFIQVLRSMCKGADASALAPPVRQLLGTGPAQARERFELFDAVGSYMHASSSPQIVILDDLHAADPSSVQLLHFLVRDLRAHPLMIVGTYREAEARLVLEIGRQLAQVAREAVVLPLRRLDRREVAEYIARATGEAPSDERVEALYRRTEGNPLFLRELLQLDAPLWARSRTTDGIREVVRARLALLPPAVRATLDRAAVLGRELATDVLAALAGITEDELGSQLATAADAGVVEPITNVRWRFTHVLLLDALYADLTGHAALHFAAARELQRRAGDPSEIAHHMRHALPAASLADVAGASLAAAARAMNVLAFEDAAAVLARVVDLLAPEPRWQFEVLLALGVARIHALAPGGRETCERAAAIARSLGDGELFARAVLGSASEYDPGVRDDALIALLDQALAMLPPGDGALRARCMAQLAAERQPEPDTAGPLALARAAVAMARRVGDRDALGRTLSTVGLAMFAIGDPHERFANDSEALQFARDTNNQVLEMRVHLLLSLDAIELGDLAAATAHFDRYAALSGARTTNRTRSIAGSMVAFLELWRGNFAEARRRHAEIEALAHIDPRARDGIGGVALALGIARATECFDDAVALEAELRAKLGTLHHQMSALIAELVICQLHASAGDRERTTTQLARVRAQPMFAQLREASWLALLVEAIQLAGDTELAAAIYPILLPRAARFFTLGPLGAYAEPPYSRFLGQLALVLGKRQDAIAHFTDAEARTTRAGMRSHLAPLRLELARVIDDPARAKELLDSARTLAAELGQTRTLQAIEGAPASPFTLAREGELWTVAAHGKTIRLKDSRGLRVLSELVSRPGEELHVLQLVSPTDDERDHGDAGPVLDTQAIRDYRARLLDLRETLDEAESRGDRGRAERTTEEIELLTQELARAVGLGGRQRRTGGAAERARTTIQKRLRDAIRRIEEGIPELGRHLDQTIRTGMFCGYLPDGRPRR